MNKWFAILCLCLLNVGCHSYEMRVYDVQVKNDSAVPITIWLTKNGPPYEPGWLAPEDIAIESPKAPEKIIGGVIVPQGKTADTGPLKGQFEASTSAMLRIYSGQLNLDQLLAASSPDEKARIDLPLHPGPTNLVVTGSAGMLEVKETAHPSTAPSP